MPEGPERERAHRGRSAPRSPKLKEKALAAGGLYVLGTERHESRRIDNQLRGRSGRQGDPGHSKFFLSLQDDLMRIFGSERMDGMLQKLGLKEGEAIIHPWINRALEKAQQKVEARNFDIRKNLLKFDDVMNDQRKVIFEQRIELMGAGGCDRDRRRHAPRGDRRAGRQAHPREGLCRAVGHRRPARRGARHPRPRPAGRRLGQGRRHRRRRGARAHDPRRRRSRRRTRRPLHARTSCARSRRRCCCRRSIICGASTWSSSTICARSIGFRGYAQRDPLNEYKTEAFELFQAHADAPARGGDRADDARRARPAAAAPGAGGRPRGARRRATSTRSPARTRWRPHDTAAVCTADLRRLRCAARRAQIDPQNPATWGKVQRNAPCPCGSGKKYKHCHGRFA